MNLRCKECGTQSYSASPDVVIRNQVRCGECGGELAQLEYEEERREDREDGEGLSGA